MTDHTTESISKIVEDFSSRPEMLVQILQTIVQIHGWVSEDTIRQLASELNLSRADSVNCWMRPWYCSVTRGLSMTATGLLNRPVRCRRRVNLLKFPATKI